MTLQVIVAVDVEFEHTLVATLGDLEDVEVKARPADDSELLAAVVAGVGDIVVLGEYFTGADSELVRRIHGNGAKVLGFGAEESAVATWDVDDCVSPWVTPADLLAALRRTSQSMPVPPKPETAPTVPRPNPGTVVAVWGTGSAPGRSTLANSVAYVVAQDARCVLLDADTVNSAQAALLGILSDTPQIAALCRASDRLSRDIVSESVTQLSETFHVVTGLSRANRWPEIKPAYLERVLDTLRLLYPVTVVDLADRIDPDDDYADPHYDRHSATRVTLEHADHILVVGTGDPMGLKKLVDLLDHERLKSFSEHVTVVINRVRESAVGSNPERKIAETLTKFTYVTDPVFVPEATKDVDRAVLAGRAVTEHAPRSEFTRAVHRVYQRLPTATRHTEADRKRTRRIRL